MEPAEARADTRAEARFRPHQRIRRRAEFQRVYDHGIKIHGRFVTLFALPNGRHHARLGVVATRRIGGAVVRNRAKRLIREVFRRSTPAAGFDVVVVAKREGIGVTLTSLEDEYRRLLSRARRAQRL